MNRIIIFYAVMLLLCSNPVMHGEDSVFTCNLKYIKFYFNQDELASLVKQKIPADDAAAILNFLTTRPPETAKAVYDVTQIIHEGNDYNLDEKMGGFRLSVQMTVNPNGEMPSYEQVSLDLNYKPDAEAPKIFSVKKFNAFVGKTQVLDSQLVEATPGTKCFCPKEGEILFFTLTRINAGDVAPKH